VTLTKNVIIDVPTDSRVRRDAATWHPTPATAPVEGGGQGCPPVRNLYRTSWSQRAEACLWKMSTQKSSWQISAVLRWRCIGCVFIVNFLYFHGHLNYVEHVW